MNPYEDRAAHEAASLRAVELRLLSSGRSPHEIRDAIARDYGHWPLAAVYSLLAKLRAAGKAHERDGVWFPGSAAGQAGTAAAVCDTEVGPAPSSLAGAVAANEVAGGGAGVDPVAHGEADALEALPASSALGLNPQQEPEMPPSRAEMIRADLAAHPGSMASQVAARLGFDANEVSRSLSNLYPKRVSRTGFEGAYRYSLVSDHEPTTIPEEIEDLLRQRKLEGRLSFLEEEVAGVDEALGFVSGETRRAGDRADRIRELLGADTDTKSVCDALRARVHELESKSDLQNNEIRGALSLLDHEHLEGIVALPNQPPIPERVRDLVRRHLRLLVERGQRPSPAPTVEPCPETHVDVWVEIEDVAAHGAAAAIDAYVHIEEPDTDDSSVVVLVRVPRTRPSSRVIDARRAS
jgi:hypothetical protein